MEQKTENGMRSILVKNIPENLHRKMKIVAAANGKTLRIAMIDLMISATEHTAIEPFYAGMEKE